METVNDPELNVEAAVLAVASAVPENEVIFIHRNKSYIPTGWRCPTCGSVFSPSTTICLFCGREPYRSAAHCGVASHDVNLDIENPCQELYQDLDEYALDLLIGYANSM